MREGQWRTGERRKAGAPLSVHLQTNRKRVGNLAEPSLVVREDLESSARFGGLDVSDSLLVLSDLDTVHLDRFTVDSDPSEETAFESRESAVGRSDACAGISRGSRRTVRRCKKEREVSTKQEEREEMRRWRGQRA
jgi:hypothetical protein